VDLKNLVLKLGLIHVLLDLGLGLGLMRLFCVFSWTNLNKYQIQILILDLAMIQEIGE